MNAQTIDVTYRSGTAGQIQDDTVAAVNMLDDIAAQRDVHVEGKEDANTQQSDQPGQGTAGVQPGPRHEGGVPEGLAHSDIPAETGTFST